MEFKIAKLDRPAIITTLAVTLLLVVLSIFFLIKVPFGWIFSILMMAIIFFSYLLSPNSYSFAGGKLIIHKTMGRRISIPLEEVEAYTLVPNFAKLRISRMFGNGGIFGYYGAFSSAEYGMISCQLRSLKDVFLIKAKHGTYAISPAQKKRFNDYFVNAVQSSQGKTANLVPASPSTMRQANPLVLLLPIAIFIMTVIIVLALYWRLPGRIAVHFDMQGNPNGWASRTSFLISGLVPAAVLLILNTAIFFFVRRTTTKPTLPYLIVGLFSVFQLFISYVSFDTYWINIHNRHLIPFPYSIVSYMLIIAVVLFVYYRTTKTSA
jgi:hypothetical protein